MILVLLRTGMRIGELRDLKMAYVHLRECRRGFMKGKRVVGEEWYISVMMRCTGLKKALATERMGDSSGAKRPLCRKHENGVGCL